jgi:hypothetical protein
MGQGRQAGRLRARRLQVTSALAFLGHALVLSPAFVMTTGAPPAAPSPAAAGAPPDTLDIEWSAPPEPTPPAEPLDAPAARPGAGLPRRPAPATRVAAAPAGGLGALAGPAGDGPVGDAPGLEQAPGASPSAAVTSTALPDGLPPPLMPRAVRAPRGVLEIPLATRQGQTGTSASAQLMATVQRSADAGGPPGGRGTIRVVIDADGSVSSVTATGVGWEEAARRIRAALGGRRLTVPKGARGLVVSFAAEARVTRAPAVLTGEARAQPARAGTPEWAAPPTDDNHRGAAVPPPNMAVIDALALVPLPRRVVTVVLLGEEPR